MEKNKSDIEYALLKDKNIDQNGNEIGPDEDEFDDDGDEEDILFDKPTKQSTNKKVFILLFCCLISFILLSIFFIKNHEMSSNFYAKIKQFNFSNINFLHFNQSSFKINQFIQRFINNEENEFMKQFEIEKNKNHSAYLIQTGSCIIPNSPIFDEETRKLFTSRAGTPYECPKGNFTKDIKRINDYYVTIPENHVCQGQEVIRRVSDEWYTYGKDLGPLKPGVHDFRDIDAVEITCNKTYKKIIPLIRPKTPTETGYYSKQTSNETSKVNVLLFGIDSISRLNFHRHLVKTKQIMDDYGFIEFYGHHKVGKNTFPNLIPIVTGEKSDKWHELWNKNRKVDGLPLIYSKFRHSGYLTAYMEDMTRFGLFTGYGKNGFINDPVDYYMKPVSDYIEEKLGFTEPCYQERLETEIFYDYLGDLFDSCVNRRNQSLMAHIHMATMTHNYINHAGYMDGPVSDFFQKFTERKLHKNTVIFFFADHSLRFGPNTETKVAFYETKLPFFYVYIPDSLKLMNSFGKWLDAEQLRIILEYNARRLTSQFDIHATMMHILEKAPVLDEQFGQSLFTPISPERTCPDAGIPTEFCGCHPYIPSTNERDNQILGEKVVQHINDLMSDKHKDCAVIQLKTITKAMIRSDFVNATEGRRVFTLDFVTTPGDAKFTTIVEETGNKVTFPGAIDRLDKYEDQSKCVKDDDLRMFCYCKSLLSK